MPTFESKPLNVFISYEHNDRAYQEELRRHLGVLIDDGAIEVWTDMDIEPGDNWRKRILEKLPAADVFVPLWSKYYFVSESCRAEQSLAEAKHRQGSMLILPVVVSIVDWQACRLAELEVLPPKGLPVSQWQNADEAWFEVARAFRRVLPKRRLSLRDALQDASSEYTGDESHARASSGTAGPAVAVDEVHEPHTGDSMAITSARTLKEVVREGTLGHAPLMDALYALVDEVHRLRQQEPAIPLTVDLASVVFDDNGKGGFVPKIQLERAPSARDATLEGAAAERIEYGRSTLCQSPKDDVFALGLVAAFVIRGGDLPLSLFDGAMLAVISELQTNLAAKRCLAKALDPHPSLRFEHADEFGQALKGAMSGPRRDAGWMTSVGESDRHFVLCHADAKGCIHSTWIDAEKKEHARVDKLVATAGCHVWDWVEERIPYRRSSFHDLFTGNIENPEWRPAPPVYSSHGGGQLHDFGTGLTLFGRGPRIDTEPPPFLMVLDAGATPIGLVGPFLFLAGHTSAYSGGAHGWCRYSFHVVDLENGEHVEVLTDGEKRQILDREAMLCIPQFGDAETFEKPLGPHNLTLVAVHPSYDAHGRLGVRYQFTADICYAASDGQWNDYTVSRFVDAATLPALLAPYAELPAPLLAARRSAPTDAQWAGWSTIRSERSVELLEAAFDLDKYI